ncbi:uncharacterized protein B0J16DRAFT_317935 [Fusarium flagelliforme]|uniref:uncharacterized protein n=1 Tax=Fusarium flagelliforme TaxID=2675880 RepID=UPI001E8D72A4|nr:uncharacterized protein B0J16DRAFT_317935 [Fusarium flagelliforme]KAH7188266.1 hypothetical protein B0J16DRAFT_317935 [Fusarium flagelliforme]
MFFRIFTHTKSIAQSRIVSSVSPISTQHHVAIFTTKNEHAVTNLESLSRILSPLLAADNCKIQGRLTAAVLWQIQDANADRDRVPRSLAKVNLALATEEPVTVAMRSPRRKTKIRMESFLHERATNANHRKPQLGPPRYPHSQALLSMHISHTQTQHQTRKGTESSVTCLVSRWPAIFSKVGSQLHLNITLIIAQCTFIYLRKVYQLGIYRCLSVENWGVERGIRSKRRNRQPDNSFYKRLCTQVI